MLTTLRQNPIQVINFSRLSKKVTNVHCNNIAKCFRVNIPSNCNSLYVNDNKTFVSQAIGQGCSPVNKSWCSFSGWVGKAIYKKPGHCREYETR